MRLMDREDETAEEVNNWAKGKTIEGMTNQFYFHKFKIYQLEEARDIVDFGTARTYGGNKIIIEFEYHQKANKYAESATPTRVTGSNYETKEERAARQVYIIRQSSLATAVDLLGQGASTDTVIETAKVFEAYVLGNPGSFDDLS